MFQHEFRLILFLSFSFCSLIFETWTSGIFFFLLINIYTNSQYIDVSNILSINLFVVENCVNLKARKEDKKGKQLWFAYAWIVCKANEWDQKKKRKQKSEGKEWNRIKEWTIDFNFLCLLVFYLHSLNTRLQWIILDLMKEKENQFSNEA